MKDKRSSGFCQVGRLEPLQDLVREKPSSRANEKLLEAAVEIKLAPDAVEKAYLAWQFVHCTLPHSDPGDVPIWTRTNGDFTLVLARTEVDPKTLKPIGYPYGSIPRLLLFWINTEAVRTGKRRLDLGDTFSSFLRELGLNPRSGGGRRGDHQRVPEQMKRLFGSAITFQHHAKFSGMDRDRRKKMTVTTDSELWWDTKRPDQGSLWGSWIELGENFFQAITKAPVPTDLRALRALKQSPLALDLYAWATHKAYISNKMKIQQRIPWNVLMDQFGADYTDPKDFRKKARKALRKIESVFPGLKLRYFPGGVVVLATSRPAILPENR